MNGKSPLSYKAEFLDARRRFYAGEIGEKELFAAADAYIDSLREFKKRTGKKLQIPSRSYLIRAL